MKKYLCRSKDFIALVLVLTTVGSWTIMQLGVKNLEMDRIFVDVHEDARRNDLETVHTVPWVLKSKVVQGMCTNLEYVYPSVATVQESMTVMRCRTYTKHSQVPWIILISNNL